MSKDTPVAPDAPERVFIRLGLALPILIESIAAGEKVEYVMGINQDCRWVPAGGPLVRILDKHGVVFERVLTIPPNASSQNWSFSLSGTGPWLIAAQGYPCGVLGRSNVTWLGEGRVLDDESIFYVSFPDHYDNVTFALEPGALQATATWRGGPGVWRTIFSKPTITSGQGSFFGTIEGLYPSGARMRLDSYGLTSGHSASFEPVQYFSGEYKIIVNASQPPIEKIEMQYMFHTLTMAPPLCDLGFEWPWLCDGDP